MRTQNIRSLVLLAGLAVGLIAWQIRPQPSAAQSPPQRWEYKIVYEGLRSIDKNLNNLGNDGWEVVATIPREFQGISGSTGYVLKRPK